MLTPHCMIVYLNIRRLSMRNLIAGAILARHLNCEKHTAAEGTINFETIHILGHQWDFLWLLYKFDS